VNGAPQRFEAVIVVVSCGAANSAALLPRSANEKHPQGLANGSGQSVGTICFITARPR
jgi:hypothetical protein